VSARPKLYRQTAGVRIRSVPELESCIVFVPETRKIFYIDATCEIVAHSCVDRITELKLAACYFRAVVPAISRNKAERLFKNAVNLLVQNGIIEVVGKGMGSSE